MTEHKKIAIRYQKDQPFVVCNDCPWYDEENSFLLPYDENTKKTDIDKQLAEHNAKIGDIYSQTLTKVKEKSVIKWLGNDIWCNRTPMLLVSGWHNDITKFFLQILSPTQMSFQKEIDSQYWVYRWYQCSKSLARRWLDARRCQGDSNKPIIGA